jgi:hypothetical protein
MIAQDSRLYGFVSLRKGIFILNIETTFKSAFDVQRTVKIYIMLKTILYALTQARNFWTEYSEHG